MIDEFNDSLAELVSTEKLSSFSVIDQFCDSCTEVTPHHVDDSVKIEDLSEVITEAPLSVLECVVCREQEENWLNQPEE